MSSVLISKQGKPYKRRKLNEGQADHPLVQRAIEEQIRQAMAQQEDAQESQVLGNFVYPDQPGNTP